MKKPQKTRAAPPVNRRDGAGHIDPRYAAELLAMSGKDVGEDPDAFLNGEEADDPMVEHLGESVIEAATSGEDLMEDALNEDLLEEIGGPFVETSSGDEIAEDTDESNPEDATREPFPRT